MTYIIAEAGTGHFDNDVGRSFVKAQNFIISASQVGADAVKFQMFVRDEPLFCPMSGDERRMKRWNNTVLPLNWWRDLQKLAKEYNIDLLWSAFQPTCVEWLKELKPRYVKVASRARGCFPYSKFPDETIFIVSGDYVPIYRKCERLRCVSEYPSPLKHNGYPAGCMYSGISDHSGTIWPGLDTIFNRGKFLEVHFKIPGADMGNDEPVCLTVDQLKLLCDARDAYARMHPNIDR